MALAKASSQAGELPTAGSLTNANITCRHGGEESSQGITSSSNSSSASSPCSEGSLCLEGDVGVYCQCYLQRSTLKQVRALHKTNMEVQFSFCNVVSILFMLLRCPHVLGVVVAASTDKPGTYFLLKESLHALLSRQISGEPHKTCTAMVARLQTINLIQI